jgi:hypothetical protein
MDADNNSLAYLVGLIIGLGVVVYASLVAALALDDVALVLQSRSATQLASIPKLDRTYNFEICALDCSFGDGRVLFASVLD